MQTFIWGPYKTKYYIIHIWFFWWRCLCTYWQLCITDCVETQYALPYLWTIYWKRRLILAYLICHLILNSKICIWLRLESFVVEEFKWHWRILDINHDYVDMKFTAFKAVLFSFLSKNYFQFTHNKIYFIIKRIFPSSFITLKWLAYTLADFIIAIKTALQFKVGLNVIALIRRRRRSFVLNL